AALFAAIDGTMTLETLVDSGQPTRLEAARVLFAANALGIVAFRGAAAQSVKGDTDDSIDLIHAEVRRLERLLREGRYSEALQVERGSDALDERVAQIENQFRPLLDEPALPSDVQRGVLEVLTRLPRAALALRASPASLPSKLPPPLPKRESNSDELDDRVSRVLQAERLYRQGRKALAARRAREALSLLEKATRLAPNEGEFLIYLGAARYDAASSQTERQRALDELRDAATRMPKMYVAHLQLARALRDEGEFRLARDAYARALEAEPAGREALDELQALP
ncbi:MAG: hypothetical protein AAF645_30225, partial [Myxococcota bacterium]